MAQESPEGRKGQEHSQQPPGLESTARGAEFSTNTFASGRVCCSLVLKLSNLSTWLPEIEGEVEGWEQGQEDLDPVAGCLRHACAWDLGLRDGKQE